MERLLDKLIGSYYSYNIDWNKVMEIPEFKRLEGIGYHSEWHTEKDAMEHTYMVVNETYKLPEWETLNTFEKKCLLGAALFHDIGKGVSAKIGEDMNWSFPKHAVIGEKITRYLLWEEPIEVRERICSLIRYHMKPKFFEDKGYDNAIVEKTIIEISHNSNCKLLYLLDKCDRAGALGPHREKEIKKCEDFKFKAILLDCYDNPFYFFDDYHKFDYFHDDTYVIPKNSKDYIDYCCDNGLSDKRNYGGYFDVHIMCGIAGSGKTTFTKKYMNLPIISRDLIRVHLGYIDSEGKFKGNKEQEDKVSIIVNEKIKEYCDKKQSFVYDNLNIRKGYRDEFINMVKPYKPIIHIHYFETERYNNISRRKGQIDENKIIKMQKEMDMPTPSECFYLKIYRN
jgi:putative nucleotidyltransferase with HDIG domain